ncbi:tolB protein [Candidatus Magnetoovum chiemensis]|nr:tolB protein [Candidatus Magnetoovum chiemensis]
MKLYYLCFIIIFLLSCNKEQEVIVFSSNRDGNFELYSMTADGKSQQRLTKNDWDDRYPSIYNNGDIVYVSRQSGKDDIYKINIKDKKPIKLTGFQGANRYATFSPDGQNILFISNRKGENFQIYIMDKDGKNQRPVTNNPYDNRSPSFSPEGDKIVFVSKKDKDAYEVYVMDSSGANEKQLTNLQSYSFAPRFSRDGKSIAFYSDIDGDYSIYTIDADGKNLRKITTGGEAVYPYWSPDGTRIVYTFFEGAVGYIQTIGINGEDMKRLTTSISENLTPRWERIN